MDTTTKTAAWFPTNVEVLKSRATKYNKGGWEVSYDCAGGCGKKQSRFVPIEKAAQKDKALYEVLGGTPMTCYECEYKALTADEKMLREIGKLNWDIAYRRKTIETALADAVKNTTEELDRMKAHGAYIPFVNSMTNWVRHHAEKCNEEAARVNENIKVIRAYQGVMTTRIAFCSGCGSCVVADTMTEFKRVGGRRGEYTDVLCEKCTAAEREIPVTVEAEVSK